MLVSPANGGAIDLDELFRRAGPEPTIGRSGASDLCLSQAFIDHDGSPVAEGKVLLLSRSHAKLSVANGQLLLRDLGTINGTFVNNQKLTGNKSKALHDHDVISFGGTNPMPFENSASVPNPFTFVCKRLQDFLAHYHPNSTATAPVVLATQPVTAMENPVPEEAAATNEVFTFSRPSSAARRAAAAAAAGPSRQPASVEVVDLTSIDDDHSPPPQRRPKRSKTGASSASAAVNDAAVAATAAAALPPPEPAAAAPPKPAEAAAPNAFLTSVRDSYSCTICQELLVGAYTFSPCGHLYCAGCLVGWLDNHQDCPTCRTKANAAPVRQLATDNMIEGLMPHLDAEEREVITEKREDWEKNRREWENKLTAFGNKVSRGGSGGGHRGGGARGMPGMPQVVDNSTGLHQMLHQQQLMGMQDPFSVFGGLPGLGSAVAAMRSVQRPPPRRHHHRQSQQVYRVESVQPRESSTCHQCRQFFQADTVRIGRRSAPSNAQQDRSIPWNWHHLDCLPQANWSEARSVGAANLPNLRPEHKALVRAKMQM